MEQLGPMFFNAFFIMILGMSIVFIFLLILITSVTISSHIIRLTGLDEIKEEPKKRKKTKPIKNEDENIAAAITAAIIQHRKKQDQD